MPSYRKWIIQQYYESYIFPTSVPAAMILIPERGYFSYRRFQMKGTAYKKVHLLGGSPYVSCSQFKKIINHVQKMSCTAWCKYICSYVKLHVKWWVIAGQSETGQRAVLWHAPWAHTGGINNCLVLLYKSPDWCPWCCHMSEDEPTLSHWNRGKWRWCHSGPPFWLWCHQQNKSSRSCPQRCLLTSGKDGGGGEGGGETKGGRE